MTNFKLGNHFTLSLRGHIAVNPKLQNFREKIKKNEELFKKVEPPYKEARSKFEKFLNLRGSELLQEWGICGKDFKLIKKHKGENNGEMGMREEEKVDVLDMDHLDRSYMGSSMRLKRKTVTKKKSGKKIKHDIHNIQENSSKYDSCGKVDKLDVADLRNIKQKKNKEIELKKAASDEKVRKRIEKRHLNKPYKTEAIIDEKDEDSADTPGKEGAYYTSPAQKTEDDEELNDYVPQSLTKPK